MRRSRLVRELTMLLTLTLVLLSPIASLTMRAQSAQSQSCLILSQR